jgi:hypothetical protein|tara:strand:+ start:1199 stop:1420 length:222 start_codon:yes stop_codon:yes gene_type:complete
MNNVMAMVNDMIKGLTGIAVGLIGLGVVVGILFGDLMGVNVVGGLLGLVSSLGEAGFVGLLVAIILIHLFTKE